MISDDGDMTLILDGLQTSPQTPRKHTDDEAGAMVLDSPVTPSREEFEDDGSDNDYFSEPSPSICTKASVRKVLCMRPRLPVRCATALDIHETTPATIITSSPTSIDITSPPEEIETQSEYLPFRMNIDKFELLTQSPAARAGIRTLTVNLASTESITLAEDSSRFLRPILPEGAAKTEDFRHVEVILNDSTPLESLASLRRALRRLGNIRVLRLTCNNSPWTEPTLDPVASVELYRSKMSCIQQCVLDTLPNTTIRLHQLVIEPFMLSDLALPSSLDAHVMDVFSFLTSLRLDLVYMKEPFQQGVLEYFLSFLPNLKELRLRAVPTDWAPKEIDFLPATQLKHLESLDLRCLHFRLDSFAMFLSRHSKTIKHLSLVSLDGLSPPWNPCVISWDLIFLLISAKFQKLESVFINGVYRQEGLGSQVFYQESEKEKTGCYRDGWAMRADIMERFLVDGGKYPEPVWQSIVD